MSESMEKKEYQTPDEKNGGRFGAGGGEASERKEPGRDPSADGNGRYRTVLFYACGVSAITVALLFLLLNISGVAGAFGKFLSIVTPITIGFVIAYLINPLVRFAEKWLGRFVDFVCGRIDRKKAGKTAKNGKAGKSGEGRLRAFFRSPKLLRILGIVFACLVLYLLFRLLIGMLIPQVVASYDELLGKLSYYISEGQSRLLEFASKLPFTDPESVNAKLRELISGSFDLLKNVTPFFTSFAASAMEQIKNIVIGVILSLYFLYSKEKLASQLSSFTSSLIGKKKYGAVSEFLRLTDSTFGGFIKGKIVDSFIIGLITFVVLWICRIPYYQLVAVIIGVTNIIPYFGPIIGAVPCAFIIFVSEPVKALWFIVIIIIIQQFDGNVLGPKIISQSVGLSSLGVIVAITVMGGLLGIFGMFIGVPLFALLLELGKRGLRRLEKKRASETGKGDGSGV